MADVVALRAALTRLGFSAKGAGFITDNQGLDTLDEFKVLTIDEIEGLCKVKVRITKTPNGQNFVGILFTFQYSNPGTILARKRKSMPHECATMTVTLTFV